MRIYVDREPHAELECDTQYFAKQLVRIEGAAGYAVVLETRYENFWDTSSVGVSRDR